MNTSIPKKSKSVLKAVWKAHKPSLIVAGVITACGIAGVITALYFLVFNPSTSLVNISFTQSPSSSSSTGRAIFVPPSISSSSSSSTAAPNGHSSSSSSSSSSPRISSSSSSSSTGSSSIPNNVVDATTPAQGYFSVVTQAPTGVIQTYLPPLHRLDSTQYGFYFFSSLYVGYANSINFNLNTTDLTMNVSYNAYNSVTPAILLSFNQPPQRTSGGYYFINYQVLGYFYGTADIDGRCGNVTVNSTSGLLFLTPLSNNFINPTHVYCTNLFSTLYNPANAVLVPNFLQNQNGFVDYKYNGCTQNLPNQVIIRYFATNSSIIPPINGTLVFSFEITTNQPYVDTPSCDNPTLYQQLIQQNTSSTRINCVPINNASCPCLPEWTGPQCTDSLVLQLELPQQPNGTVAAIQSPFGDWYATQGPGFTFQTPPAFANIANTDIFQSVQLCDFFGQATFSAANDLVLELNTQANPYLSNATSVDNCVIFQPTTTSSSSFQCFGIQQAAIQPTSTYFFIMSYQNQIDLSSAAVNGFCNVYTTIPTIDYSSIIGGSWFPILDVNGNYFATVRNTKLPISVNTKSISYFYLPITVVFGSSSVTTGAPVSYYISSGPNPFNSTVYCNQNTMTPGFTGSSFVFNFEFVCDMSSKLFIQNSSYYLAVSSSFTNFPTFYAYIRNQTRYFYNAHVAYRIDLSNPCNYNQCLHGATCSNVTATTYSCNCPPGTSGTFCQNTICTNTSSTICGFQGNSSSLTCVFNPIAPYYTCVLPFVTSWTTSNTGGVTATNQIALPLVSNGQYNFTAFWGDGTNNTITASNQNTHAYPSAGTYTLTITGQLQGWSFAGAGDAPKLVGISQFGVLSFANNGGYFQGCKNLLITAVDTLNLTSVTSMANMFMGCAVLTTVPSMNLWNTGSITNMSSLFSGAAVFNGNVSVWNTSSVTTMNSMFSGAVDFNQPLNAWNTQSVTDMSFMFYADHFFNQPIGNWDVSKVKTMIGMFQSFTTFNQSINNWNVGAVTSMANMFDTTTNFNQPIGLWNVQSVTSMNSMFHNALVFNQDLSLWNTVSLIDMSFMFENAVAFNSNISTWNTGSVTTLMNTFLGTTVFNQNINNWNVAKVTSMFGTFQQAPVFNQPLNNWITSSVKTMASMFYQASAFNQALPSWNTQSVTSMDSMFYQAINFNSNISTWNTQSVTDFFSMFFGSSVFNQPGIGNWNISSATTLRGMFAGGTIFNQPLPLWNTAEVTDMSVMFDGAVYSQDISTWNFNSVTTMSSILLGDSSWPTVNYNNLLIALSSATLQHGVPLSTITSFYSCSPHPAAAARTVLISAPLNWVITDNGCQSFCTEFNTGNALCLAGHTCSDSGTSPYYTCS